MTRKTVVTGVIGVDCHIVGNWLLRHACEEAGLKVVGLGIYVSQEDFIKAAIETNAAAILVSSICGHAFLDCEGFREKCDEAGLKDILLYLGGNLTAVEEDPETIKKRFKEMGFNRVYLPDTPLSTCVRELKEDLGLEV